LYEKVHELVCIKHYNCICILVLTTQRMATYVAETCRWLRCNKLTFLHPRACVGLIKKLNIWLMTGKWNIEPTIIYPKQFVIGFMWQFSF